MTGGRGKRGQNETMLPRREKGTFVFQRFLKRVQPTERRQLLAAGPGEGGRRAARPPQIASGCGALRCAGPKERNKMLILSIDFFSIKISM